MPVSSAENLICKLENSNSGFLKGRVYDDKNRSKRIQVFLVSNGRILATTASNVHVDEEKNGVFAFDLASILESEVSHKINIYLPDFNAFLFKEEIPFSWKLTSDIKGALDFVDDNFNARGWAYGLYIDENLIVDVYVNGIKAATCRANGTRPDLQVKNGKLNSGFNCNLSFSAFDLIDNIVSIRANGNPVSKSVKVSFSESIKIRFGAVENGFLKVCLAGAPFQEADIDIYINGKFYSEVKASAVENEAMLLEGYFKLPAHFEDGKQRVYQAFYKADGQEFKTDVEVIRYPEYKYHIDTVSLTGISGWIFRTDSARSISLLVSDGTSTETKILADIVRDDVKNSLSHVSNRLGFEVTFSESHLQCKNIILQDVDTNVVICEVSVQQSFDLLQNNIYSLKGVAANAVSDIVSTTKDELDVKIKNLPKNGGGSKPSKVTVIVPVYEGYIETAECIESIVSAKNSTPFSLIIINDATPNPEVKEYISFLKKRDFNFEVIFLDRLQNKGFSEAVNAGFIIADEEDVVIVNADAVIQNNWLDKLVACASKDRRIATVTPFTNNGEVATFPYICKALNVRSKELAKEINDAAEEVNSGEFVDIPVAIGFCMYIKRECLEDIGFFDATKWGRGYGEEVEFCIHAMLKGWRHVLAADSFAIHRGNVSFGSEKLERVIKSSKIISKDYPFYDAYIQRYLKVDPARSLRRKISVKLLAGDLQHSKTILMISHGYGGGTQKYLDDLTGLYKSSGCNVISLTSHQNGSLVLGIPTNQEKWEGFYAGLHEEYYYVDEHSILISDLDFLGIDTVHVHSPFGLSKEVFEWVTSQENYNLTVHDYAWICPWVTMLSPSLRLIENMDWKHNDAPAHVGLKYWVDIANSKGQKYQESFKDLFRNADKIFAGSDDVKRRMSDHGLTGNYVVKDHPLYKAGSRKEIIRNVVRRDRVKLAVVGGISDIKGYWKIYDLARTCKSYGFPVDILVIGFTQDNKIFSELDNVQILGRYEDKDLDNIFSIHQPDALLYLYLLPETFSYTLSLAFRYGIWPIVSDVGATAERVRKHNFGSIVSLEDSAEALCSRIVDIANDAKSRAYQPLDLPVVERIEDYID